MKRIKMAWVTISLAAVATIAPAQAPTLHFEPANPSLRPEEIVLGTPRSDDSPPESWLRQDGYLQVRNVDRATLLPFRAPAHRATGEAVVVAPGGGFLGLAIENEGWSVAQELANHGITAFVLKYRVLPTPASFDVFRAGVVRAIVSGRSSFPRPAGTPPRSIQDAAAALRYVRDHAASYGIDPNKVGMMGFSAGAALAISAVVDLPASERPAFIAPIYPRMNARQVPQDAPPMFVAIANDDTLMAGGSMGLISSWQAARRPLEFHLYQAGGHGFGLGNSKTTTSSWFDAFLRWREYNRTIGYRNLKDTAGGKQ